jgi:hypothetical protein
MFVAKSSNYGIAALGFSLLPFALCLLPYDLLLRLFL